MSFTQGLPTEEIANYIELANEYLDKIPVEDPEDFEKVKIALSNIQNNSDNPHIPPVIKGRVADIKYLIDNPDSYVRPQFERDFKSIILGRVAAKIREIDSLTPKEKERYIANQREIREQATQNHEVMARYTEPAEDSEAHVLSYQEWLRERQAAFNAEIIAAPQGINPWFNAGPVEEVARLLVSSLEVNGFRPLRRQNAFPNLNVFLEAFQGRVVTVVGGGQRNELHQRVNDLATRIL